MTSQHRFTLALLALASVTAAQAAAFNPANLVVSRVGDGTVLVNSGGAISLLEYTTAGSAVQTIAVPTSSLQWSGSATSEGAISLSKDKSQLTLVGYNDPFTGSGSLASRTDVQAPRAYLNVAADGTVGTSVNVLAYSGNNIRSGVTDGTGVWMAGGSTGTVYNNGSNATIQGAITNTRVANIDNNNLYFSTASGTNRGIYAFAGTPTTATAATYLINTGASSSPYDFAFNDAGNVAYIADTASVFRYTFDGSVWTAAGSVAITGGGVTGLAVSFGGTSDSIFVVNPTSLTGVTYDSIGGSFGTQSVLASAGTNYAFRGLEFAPVVAVPEPSTYAALAGAVILGVAAVRRRRA